MKEVVFPHKLSFIKTQNKCDVCGKDNSNVYYHLNRNPYMGMISCNIEECKLVIKESFKKVTKNVQYLYSNDKDWIYVVRTSGKKESKWITNGNAYKEKENGPFWIEVKHLSKNKSKIVLLEDLEKWNNIN